MPHDGDEVGDRVGLMVGAEVVGDSVGSEEVGEIDGEIDGEIEGDSVGSEVVGEIDGEIDRSAHKRRAPRKSEPRVTDVTLQAHMESQVSEGRTEGLHAPSDQGEPGQALQRLRP